MQRALQQEEIATAPDGGQKRVGLFVSGFWFSGSGAVVDWLAGHSSVIRPAGAEMKALGRGLYPLVEIAAGRRWYGEWFARSALYPDRRDWEDLFGPSLHHRGVRQQVLGRSANLFHAGVARLREPPVLERFERKLVQLLGQDYRSDKRYRELIRSTVRALHDSQGGEALTEPRVARCVSEFLAYVHDLWGSNAAVPVLDNAVSGSQPEFVDLLDGLIFPHRLHLFVRRDPRDQFLDITQNERFSPRNPWFLQWFIRTYRRDQARLARLLKRWAEAENVAQLICFEDFVVDADNMRRDLRSRFDRLTEDAGRKGTWSLSPFDPRISEQNIGKWKHAGLRTPMAKIAAKLPEYLHPLAD